MVAPILHLNDAYFRDQGLCSGESTRLPPVQPRFVSQTRCHMWIEFVGSLLRSKRVSAGLLVFSSPQKPIFNCLSCTVSPIGAPALDDLTLK